MPLLILGVEKISLGTGGRRLNPLAPTKQLLYHQYYTEIVPTLADNDISPLASIHGLKMNMEGSRSRVANSMSRLLFRPKNWLVSAIKADELDLRAGVFGVDGNRKHRLGVVRFASADYGLSFFYWFPAGPLGF